MLIHTVDFLIACRNAFSFLNKEVAGTGTVRFLKELLAMN
jgi:hypothetical protein